MCGREVTIRERESKRFVVGKTLLRIQKLWTGLTNPIARRALGFGVGATIEHAVALGRYDFDTIVDVGANKGQFAMFARMFFPRARIISFEPLDEPAAIYAALFRDDRLTRIVCAAVGSERGRLVMRVTGRNDSSSPLDVADAHRRAFGTVVIEKREVPCGPLLDFIADGDLGARNLLKIDAQGFELEVLKGISELERFQVIYCEVSFVPLYIGQALASEVVKHLFDRGFGLVGVFNIASAQDCGQVQADMLFVRR